jgi:hypothetical protein
MVVFVHMMVKMVIALHKIFENIRTADIIINVSLSFMLNLEHVIKFSSKSIKTSKSYHKVEDYLESFLF